jgi:hypothetical protein
MVHVRQRPPLSASFIRSFDDRPGRWRKQRARLTSSLTRTPLASPTWPAWRCRQRERGPEPAGVLLPRAAQQHVPGMAGRPRALHWQRRRGRFHMPLVLHCCCQQARPRGASASAAGHLRRCKSSRQFGAGCAKTGTSFWAHDGCTAAEGQSRAEKRLACRCMCVAARLGQPTFLEHACFSDLLLQWSC